jgi:D-amino-acid dehydrogenase
MKVVILGSGISGITTAYYLAKAGYEVTVLERNPTSGMGCSYANGGQLSFSHAEPWNSKTSLRFMLKSIFLGEKSFISFSDLKNKEFLSWALKFIMNSRNSKSKDIAEKILKIGSYSKENLAKILREEKIDFHYKNDGILHFYRNQKNFIKAVKQAKFQEGLGCDVEILNAEECVKKEPTLIKLFDEQKLAGGIFFKDDASGDPALFIKAVEWICKNRYNVNFEYNTEIKNIFTNYKKITGINTDKGVFTGNCYISTLGSYGNSLLKGIGINLNIFPIKGYSLSIPTSELFLSPKIPLTDAENKIVYSKLGSVFRAAGTIEISNPTITENNQKINFLKNTIISTYSDFGDINNAKEWSGFRPYRPDCLPIVCKAKKYGNLYINAGHGSLGWTMSFATSRIIADLINKQETTSEFYFFEEMEKEIYL